MAERVFTNKQQIIEIVYDGDHDYKDSDKNIARLKVEWDKLDAQGVPVRLLLDLSRLGKTDSRARMNIIRVAQDWRYAKIAVYGASVFNRVLSELIIRVSGHKRKIKIFNTRAQALRWFNSK